MVIDHVPTWHKCSDCFYEGELRTGRDEVDHICEAPIQIVVHETEHGDSGCIMAKIAHCVPSIFASSVTADIGNFDWLGWFTHDRQAVDECKELRDNPA